ncbi:helix-turn-helix domain-containing protein [Flavivirga eckloniae]|uniref:Transcriptional regulator n=1 Tax=Flavivirga eckloniae TaxID=1803846 RepID=A0A2K9PJN9_9FLAO|nr:helix-turn-helix transcriptional regulator [Flavivirga eckloniae]AUP77235.1 transcriptional regulator [Flavivirga eckloniae]
MVNMDGFVNRLQEIMSYYGESASSFAEKIGVQRSSISHILSGRNKPSLDFILKILTAYPNVDLYWLFNGKGEFPSKSKSEAIKKETDLFSTNEALKIETPIPTPKENGKKEIERIVIFYSDGSFKNYQN